MIVNNSAFYALPGRVETEGEGEEGPEMEGLSVKSEGAEGRRDKFCENGGGVGIFADLIEEDRRESSSSSAFLTSDVTGDEEQSHSSSEVSYSPPPVLHWSADKAPASDCSSENSVVEDAEKFHSSDEKLEKHGSVISGLNQDKTKTEMNIISCKFILMSLLITVWLTGDAEVEMMKERFSKLLLGEDMSGSGNGVCTALAISNAITNLCGMLPTWNSLPTSSSLLWRIGLKIEFDWSSLLWKVVLSPALLIEGHMVV